MGRNRFADVASIVKLEIDGGDWIEIRRELTAGQRLDVLRAGIKGVAVAEDGPRSYHDQILVRRAEVAAYLVDWSFCGPDGARVRIDTPEAKRAALEALTIEDFYAIELAIDRHQQALAAERSGTAPGSSGGATSSGDSSAPQSSPA